MVDTGINPASAMAARRHSWERRFRRPAAVVGVLLATSMVASACNRSAYTRTVLKSHQEAWQAKLGALRQRQSDMAARFSALPTARQRPDRSPETASLARMQAQIASSKQALSHVEIYLADEARVLGAIIDRQDGDSETDEALNQAITQVAGTLDGQERALASAEAALTQLSLKEAPPREAPPPRAAPRPN